MDDLLPLAVMHKAVRGICFIAHPLRLRILEFLDVNGPSSVSCLTKGLKEEQVIISQNLKKLREAHLVETRRKGLFIFYKIFQEYPASIFVCLRKLFGYMTNNFYFLKEDYKVMLPKDYTTMAAGRIKLFAHIEKIRLLEYLLFKGPCHVNEMAKGLNLAPLKVSQFLKKLREDGFVRAERKGRFVVYRVENGIQTTAIKCIHKRYDSLKNKADF